MISVPDNPPDDPAALKQLLAQLLAERTVDKDQIVDLKEQVKLLRDRLFNRKSEQTVESNTPQLALFIEPESQWVAAADDADEEVVAPTKQRGKRKPLSADLPRIEVIHDLPEHELTCACGCRKHVIGEQTSEQLDIVPMQIRVIKHACSYSKSRIVIRPVNPGCGCRPAARLTDKSCCSITSPAARRRCRCACWRAIAVMS